MSVERIELAPGFSISRIIKGGWQLAEGHSAQSTSDPMEDMFTFAEAGVTTFDCADIYTGVEELIGHFLKHRKKRRGSHSGIQVLTKFVPDRDAIATINKTYVKKIVDRSLQRLGVDRLDMVQFHWWDYDTSGMVETAHWLDELRKAGKIGLLSGTNFNTKRAKEIMDAGVKLTSLQVQYSLLDNRPETGLIKLCVENNVRLLCYGTVAGGFLSELWLGAPEPPPPLENRSLIKYKLMIDEFGGWSLFQELLGKLKIVADKHRTALSSVASRYILDRQQVSGVIIGARTAKHLKENLGMFDFRLDTEDLSSIDNLISRRRGPQGDVFDIERIKDGPHGSIMKYNLNEEA